MHEEESPGFWALMFWQFQGLDEHDTGQIIGQTLAARYDATPRELPQVMDELLARLEAVEQNTSAGAKSED